MQQTLFRLCYPIFHIQQPSHEMRVSLLQYSFYISGRKIFVKVGFLCCSNRGGTTGDTDLDRETVFDITPEARVCSSWMRPAGQLTVAAQLLTLSPQSEN